MMFVINISNFRQDFILMGIVIRLAMFSIVIVSVRVYFKPPEEPAQTKLDMVLIDESISL